MTEQFYDIISSHYSHDRYLSGVTNYVQFSYVRRLRAVRRFATSALTGRTAARVLDVGTADGFVLRKVYDDNKESVAELVGNDVAPRMLEEAEKQSEGYPASYFIRGQEPPGPYNLIMEIGVPMPDPALELGQLQSNLAQGGHLILMVANRHSLYTRLKLKNKSYITDYLGFKEYEALITERFEIMSRATLGMFIPFLWKLPCIFARPLQSMAEALFSVLVPSLLHERVYLLRKPSRQ